MKSSTNLQIKKAAVIHQINDKLLKHINLSLVIFLHFFFTPCINLAFTLQIARVVMPHKQVNRNIW